MNSSIQDPRIGKYYVLNDSKDNKKPTLIRIVDIQYSVSHFASVFISITSNGEEYVDRTVFLSYLKQATSEQILLYWFEK